MRTSAPKKRTDEPCGSMAAIGSQVVILCAAAFISPLVAGKLTPIPALCIQGLVILAALVWVIRSGRQGFINLPGRASVGCAAVFAALLALSAWRSASLYLTIREFSNFGSYLLVFLMIAGIGSDRRVYSILGCAVLSALVVSAVGVREYALAGSGGWRVFSTFFNPDFLSGFAGMMLPVAVAWYLSRTSSDVGLVTGLCAVGLFANLLVSGSRFGAVAAVGGILIFAVPALVSRSLGGRQVVRALILLVPLLLIYRALNTPLAARVSSVKVESHSGGFRIGTWRGTVRMAEANPVHGTGLGTFEVAYPRYALVGFTKLAHNSYLQLAGEAGPASSIALILLLGVSAMPPMISVVRRRIPRESGEAAWQPDRALMTCGLIGGAAASMAHNLADSDWYVTAIGIGFWMILGAAVALGGPDSSGSAALTRRRAWVIGLVLCLGLVSIMRVLAGEMIISLGDSRWTTDPEATVRDYRVAQKLDPLNAEYHRRLASAYRSLAASGETSWAQEAVCELQSAIRLEPGNAKNHYQLGRAYELAGDYADAIPSYEDALARDPNAPTVMLALARAQEAAGRKADALKTWRRLADLERTPFERIRAVPELVQPEYIFAHAALGREFERTGDPARAEREYVQALDRARRYEESVKAMGEVLDANGRRDRAMEARVAEVRDDLTARLKQSVR